MVNKFSIFSMQIGFYPIIRLCISIILVYSSSVYSQDYKIPVETFVEGESSHACTTKIDSRFDFINGYNKEVFYSTNPLVSVTKLDFEEVGNFSEGLAPVKIKGKYGFIDLTGKVVIKPEFDKVYGFREGLAAIDKGKNWGFIDKKGNLATPLYDSSTYSTYRGRSDSIEFDKGLIKISKNRKYGFLNKNGQIAIPTIYDSLGAFFDDLVPFQLNGKWGYLNRNGKVVIKPQFEEASIFMEGLGSVKLGGKWGFVDPSGKLVIKPISERETHFAYKSEIAPVQIQGKMGFINRKGEIIMEPTWLSSSYIDFNSFFGSEYKFVSKEEENYSGLVNKDGEFLVTGEWNNDGGYLFFLVLDETPEGEVPFLIEIEGSQEKVRFGRYYKDEKIVFYPQTFYDPKRFPPPFQSKTSILGSYQSNGIFLFPGDEKQKAGLFDLEGKTILDFQYDKLLGSSEDRVFVAKTNNNTLLLNMKKCWK